MFIKQINAVNNGKSKLPSSRACEVDSNFAYSSHVNAVGQFIQCVGTRTECSYAIYDHSAAIEAQSLRHFPL